MTTCQSSGRPEVPGGGFSTGSCCCSRGLLLPCPSFGRWSRPPSRLLVRLVRGSGTPHLPAGKAHCVCPPLPEQQCWHCSVSRIYGSKETSRRD